MNAMWECSNFPLVIATLSQTALRDAHIIISLSDITIDTVLTIYI